MIKSLGRGGAEMLLPETLSQHDRENFEFYYVYFLPWKNQVVKDIESHGGKVLCFSAANNVRIMMRARRIANYVKKEDIKIIHCHLPWAGIVGRIAGRLAGVPVVYTEHNKWERYNKLTYLANKFTFPWQKRVIAVSADVKHSIQRFYKKSAPQIDVVLNGVNHHKFLRSTFFDTDIRKELGIPEEAFVIGIISVFRVQKRLLRWLDIAAEIHKSNPNTWFIIVGDGPLKQEIFARAKENNMDAYLHFAGLQTEVRPYLKAMDIFMMTSEFEGLPIALLESMSMECVPACTRAGGIPELIEDEQNGLLVPVNQPELLAGKVIELISDKERMKRLGTEARKTVADRFSMKQMVASLENIYKNILN